ncbi:cytochrome P450 [Bythopirellula polymerisocia]|uniref:Biotin biosynthesis cytochrome P450 n=1 Tax=Bythopirellula polymerisocia TaxID=2528003 RepID=A0A5C6CZF2_9BACT|nr:cytochrome P450 [Bythopirellula polymerisocia]TWU30263.1 Biotin biosynthesis cytochrome P450 [Bythopirellula polymerisocia]
MTIPAPDAIPMFGSEMLADPYPLYRRLQVEDPVHWSEKYNAWFVTRFEDVAAGLENLTLSSDRSALFEDMAHSAELKEFFTFLGNRMVLADPPKHKRLRGLVSKAFTPHTIQTMRPHIQQLVDGYIDAVEQTGHMDVIHDLAFPLPATVIMEMLGVDPEDRERLKRWSDDFIVFFSNHPANISLDQYRRAQQSMNAMVDYFRTALPRIRMSDRPCLLHTMEVAEMQGDKLSEEELFANANLLLVAGHETTTNLIGNGMLALLQHREELERLRADPTLIHGAVEEMLRYGNPVQFTHRIALEDVPLGGKTIRRGQFVFSFLAAANRDPDHFPDPNRLDVTRTIHQHLAFGKGHHFCLGAPLARLEAQIAFTTILRRLSGLRLSGDKLVFRENFNLRGLNKLPIDFDALG